MLCTALDIGTSKVAAVVGDVNGKDIDIVAVGTSPCYGLKKGVVNDIEETSKAIRSAIEEAQSMADYRISRVHVGISGEHVRSINCQGMAAIRSSEVSQQDIDRAVEAAKAVNIPDNRVIVHAMPRDFIIDGQGGIKNPMQMSGHRLDANVHLATGSEYAIRNIAKCVKQCGLEIGETALEQVASSLAVLTEDERELGVCLIDIGGGTSDIAIYNGGNIVYSEVVAVAGEYVTRDIAVTLRAQKKYAEEIKLKYGSCEPEKSHDTDIISVPGVADRPPRQFKRNLLNVIITSRYTELFEIVREKLANAKVADCAVSGFVLTGGSAKLEGAVELAAKVLAAPTRLGRPKEGIKGLVGVVDNPIYATAVGLLHYAKDWGNKSERESASLPLPRKLFQSLKHWFNN